MMIHLQNASITNGTMMSTRWFRCYAFLTNTGRLCNEHTLREIRAKLFIFFLLLILFYLRRHTGRCLDGHVIMKDNINQQPIADSYQNDGERWTLFPPKW